MKSIIRWFAGNGVAANLLMVFLLISGAITVASRVRLEVFPELSVDVVTVAVPYPGAAPEEVEEGISIRIEEAVQGIEGVRKVSSNSSEGVGAVSIEALTGTDMDRFERDIEAAVDAITTFPLEAEEPQIQRVTIKSQVINVAISGDADETTLKRLGERVRDEIAALPEITQVELVNVRPYEIAIEVSESALRQYGLTLGEVADAVRRSSLDLPGGSVRTEGGEILLRAKGQAYAGPDFAALPVLTRPDGSRVRVGDVATVVDGFEETDQFAAFDGAPSVMVQVFRVGDQSAIEVADAVKRYVADARPRMPDGISLTTWRDDTVILKSRMSLLLRNGGAGLVLVFLVLTLFLRFGLAFWVTLGIPISFMGAILLMPTLDVSINLISLFAFIVVLGIVVDDAIVVGESIYRTQREGRAGLAGSIAGALGVSTPVVFAVMTTIAAFTPLMLVPGPTGKIFRVIPLIVIPTLVFSLIESLFILPNHLSHSTKETHTSAIAGGWARFQDRFASGLERFISSRYAPFLQRVIRMRYTTVSVFIGVLILTMGAVAGGLLRFTFFPPVEADYVIAMLTMPQGTPAPRTAAAVARLEEAARELEREIDGDVAPDVGTFRHVLASVGEQPYRAEQERNGPGGRSTSYVGSQYGEVMLELSRAEDRELSSGEIAQLWRERVGLIPDAVELKLTASLFSPGAPIDIQLTDPDVHRLREAADALKEKLGTYAGVFDIADSYRAGKEEIVLRLTPEGEILGVGVADLARQVRQAFYGEEVQRVQRGRDEVKVMVRFPADARRSLAELEDMRVRTPDGRAVPFSVVAHAEFGRGYSTITRADRQRTLNVTADVDLSQANANEIITDLQSDFLPALVRGEPGLQYSLEGEQREQRETMGGLLQGFLIAQIIIFTLMAVPFRSYLQPLIIMSAVPFGLVGAIWGHVLMGMNLSMLSGFGIVALSGIVVNDNLVLVDFINRERRAGRSLHDAVAEAGVARFRPIMLTSLTTFAGLLPMLLEKSVQAQFLIPMAISLAFGVMFATCISLLLVPASYVILEDVARLLRIPAGEFGRAHGAGSDTAPASALGSGVGSP